VDPETHRIELDQVRHLAKTFRPKMIIAGASSYPRIIDFKAFKQIAEEVGAFLMADMAHIAGLVAAGLHPSPVPFADFVTSTTHKTLRGPRGGFIVGKATYAREINGSVFPGIQGGPLMHTIAAKAVAFRDAMSSEFADYQRQVVINARTLGEELMSGGLQLVSGGTDNHLLMVDLTETALTGLDAEQALAKAGIVVNKNSVPYDRRGPKLTSGIRLGTPALTTRGMKEEEIRDIARLIVRVLEQPDDENILRDVKGMVHALCLQFPLHY
jgi:glycine hydroxymethyltransferase